MNLTAFQWMNEPKSWNEKNNELTVITDNKTDFWRKTYYGFIRESGHFLFQELVGDFTCEVELIADFETLYDQLGLMIRSDGSHWVKAGLEFSDDAVQISAVVTNEYSDWSVIRCDWYSGTMKIRLTRHSETVRIEYLDQSGAWTLLRLAYLEMSEKIEVGMMCCSPERSGFKATFQGFLVEEPISKELHQ